MRSCRTFLWILVGVLGFAPAAPAATLLGVRHHVGEERTRVVLDLSAPVDYRVLVRSDPPALVVQLPDGVASTRIDVEVARGPLRRISFPGNGDVGLVLSLAGEVAHRHFTLPPEDGSPDRIVVDVLGPADFHRPVGLIRPHAGEPWVVVIDAGHGGEDAGTLGCGVAREKDVVLSIAHRLAARLEGHSGLRVVLTRSEDRRVPLEERVQIAQRARGDLFLSIHANSARNPRVSGAEIFFLSLDGASDQAAAELADRENAAALVGLEQERAGEDDLVSILVDLQGSAVMERSSLLAESALGRIVRDTGAGNRLVRQAGFAVLRNLSMPAILVEVGFLTNEAEARRLASSRGQQDMAEALAHAVVDYCRANGEKDPPPPLSPIRVHTVRRGDTLWELARRYGTTVNALRAANGLRGSGLAVGQELVLP